MRPICARFHASLDSWHPVFCTLAIFLSVFCRISAVFMLFLRSSSFANPLLPDKSAFYLIAYHYHSEGRREAEGKQKGGITASRPIGSLLASRRFCKHFLPVRHCAAKVMASWREARAEKSPIWELAENCAILRGATMAFAKSRWQRREFRDCPLSPRETIKRDMFHWH